MLRSLARLLVRHSSIVALLALMAAYSAATLQTQYPINRRAAHRVAESIVELHGSGARTLVAVGAAAQDRRYGDDLAAELRAAGADVVGVVSGKAADFRRELNSFGEQDVELDAIATQHAVASLPVLRPSELAKFAEQYPSLRRLRVYSPGGYLWPSFLTRANLLNVVNQNAGVAIIAIGMTMIIITGGIDLSVGSLMALACVVIAVVAARTGGGWAGVLAGCFAALGICAAIGAATGTLVTRFRVPAFVVTLSIMMIARGLAYITAVRHHAAGSEGALGTPEAVHIDYEPFALLANGRILGVPNPVWLMAILYLIAHFVMSRTIFGRHIYAVGGNPDAARLSGISVRGVLIAVYMIAAIASGAAGAIDASLFQGGRPNAGELYELRVIAAVVVGGASLTGGQGTMFGTLIGALIMAVIENGLNMADVSSYEQAVVFGALILGASLFDQLKRRTAPT